MGEQFGELDRGNGRVFAVGLSVLRRVRVRRDCKNASRNREQQDVCLLKVVKTAHTWMNQHAGNTTSFHRLSAAHVLLIAYVDSPGCERKEVGIISVPWFHSVFPSTMCSMSI